MLAVKKIIQIRDIFLLSIFPANTWGVNGVTLLRANNTSLWYFGSVEMVYDSLMFDSAIMTHYKWRG
jgi:hypothetical protein